MAELESNPSLIDELVVDDSSVQKLFTPERIAIAERGIQDIGEGKYQKVEMTEQVLGRERDPRVIEPRYQTLFRSWLFLATLLRAPLTLEYSPQHRTPLEGDEHQNS
jgi:hypothetical protein